MNPWLLAIKLLITATLVAWLAWQADWRQIGALWADLSLRWLVLSVVLHALALLLYAVRWLLLLPGIGASLPRAQVLSVVWLGMFANNFLPAGTGPDVAKVLGLRSEAVSGKSLLGAVLVERLVGLSAVVTIGAVALLLWAPPGLAHVPAGLLLVIPAVLLIVLLGPFGDWISRRCRRPGARAWRRHLADLLDAVARYRRMPRMLLLAFGLTVVLQTLVVLAYAALGLAIDAELSLVVYFVAIPTVFLVVSLPVSIGGLGLREGSFVAIMVAAGMAEQPAIGISVLFLLELWLLTLPGGLFLLRQRPSTAGIADDSS